MALVWMSGAEWGTMKEIDAQENVDCTTANKRTGSYSYRFDTYDWMEKFLPDLTEVFVQFAFCPRNTGSWVFFALNKGTTSLVSIRKNTYEKLEVCSGWGGAVYCTGVTSLQVNNWYVVELHFKLDDANGLIELRLDGNPEASFAGNTKPGTETNFDKARWRAPGPSNNFDVDDIVIFDTTGTANNSWPNGLKVVLLKANADVSVTWTPSPSGDHYACVDEVPPSGSDYLKAESADLLEVLGLEDLPAEAQTVKGVRVDFWGLKGSTEDPDRLQLGVRIDSTDYLSSDKDLPLSQDLISNQMEQNPAGGNWSVSAVNAMQLVVKSRN